MEHQLSRNFVKVFQTIIHERYNAAFEVYIHIIFVSNLQYKNGIVSETILSICKECDFQTKLQIEKLSRKCNYN